MNSGVILSPAISRRSRDTKRSPITSHARFVASSQSLSHKRSELSAGSVRTARSIHFAEKAVGGAHRTFLELPNLEEHRSLESRVGLNCHANHLRRPSCAVASSDICYFIPVAVAANLRRTKGAQRG